MPDNPSRPYLPTLRDWLALTLLAILWGASFMAIAVAARELPALTIAAGRIALGALLLLAYLLLSGRFAADCWRDRHHWRFAIVMGLLSNAIPFTLLAWAEQHVSSSFAGLTMAFGPLAVLALAHYLVPGEAITRRRMIGFIVGLVGVLILIDPIGAVMIDDGHDYGLLPEMACLATVICYSLGSIVTRRAPRSQPLNLATQTLVASTLCIVPLTLWVDGIPTIMTLQATASLIYLGALPTALATVLLVTLIQRAGPAFFSLVNYQVPLWATLFGVVVLGESIGTQFLLALPLILLGLAIAQGRGLWRKPSQQ
ncbi:DMT family transporter [Gammaproteobacteria bacterium]|nr:DMT family transporter [Gammaproteobacteria bacterium]